MINMLPLVNQFMVKKNHSLPFIVIAVAVIMVVCEGILKVEIDVEAIMPLLVAIGIGGAAKKAVEKAFGSQRRTSRIFQKCSQGKKLKNYPQRNLLKHRYFLFYYIV